MAVPQLKKAKSEVDEVKEMSATVQKQFKHDLSILEVCMSMVIDVQFLTSTQEKIPA
jgi:hypothetical protein